jgi:hypothetical protein
VESSRRTSGPVIEGQNALAGGSATLLSAPLSARTASVAVAVNNPLSPTLAVEIDIIFVQTFTTDSSVDGTLARGDRT